MNHFHTSHYELLSKSLRLRTNGMITHTIMNFWILFHLNSPMGSDHLKIYKKIFKNKLKALHPQNLQKLRTVSL